MFCRYYNLTFNPFDKTLPAKHAFQTKDFKELTSRVDHLVEQGGLGLFCAGAGFGKTFALRSWTERQNRNRIKFSYVCLSTITTMEFYRMLCLEMGLDPAFRKVDMFRAIQEHLTYTHAEKSQRTVIALDEAQYLRADILRDLKLLTNFEMDSRNYLTLILLGQPLLADLLSRPTNEALRQRVIVNYTFEGLQANEAPAYAAALLRSAGGSPDILDEAAVRSAYGVSAGSLRQFNAIITGALMIGAQHESPSVTSEMVLSASEEVRIR